MIVPRSAGRSQCDTAPTLPGQPLACTRPLKNMKTRKVANELAKPKITLIAIEMPRPPRSKTRGPHRRPIKLLMNRSEEHTSELQSLRHIVCRLLLEKKNEIR